MNQQEVQLQKCKTCPFGGEDAIDLTPDRWASIYNYLCNPDPKIVRQHLCHSANNQKVCRGGRDVQLRFLTSTKMIEEPTDEAFNRAMYEELGDRKLTKAQQLIKDILNNASDDDIRDFLYEYCGFTYDEIESWLSEARSQALGDLINSNEA